MAKAPTSRRSSRRSGRKRPPNRSRGPASPSRELTGAQRLEIHRWMLLTRKLEERLVHLYRQNQVVGGLYRSLGQEAETVAAVYALQPQDVVAPLIRNLGAVLVKGYPPRDVVMQYMARSGGPTGGKDLNVHFGSVPEPGVLPPVSMLGDTIPVMAGVALAAKLRGEDRVGLAFIGDGGTSTGAFYEGLNLAAVWRLPLIVVAENNGYAYSTPTSRQMAVKQIAEKAAGLGIAGETVDGNDPIEVHDAVSRARTRAAAGEGPTLVEVLTYRRKGHAEHDMQKYVPEGEIEWWEKNNDPVDRFRARLLEEGHASAEDLERMEAEVREVIETEVEAAIASPLPDPSVALERVYADPPRADDHLAPYRPEGSR